LEPLARGSVSNHAIDLMPNTDIAGATGTANNFVCLDCQTRCRRRLGSTSSSDRRAAFFAVEYRIACVRSTRVRRGNIGKRRQDLVANRTKRRIVRLVSPFLGLRCA
jgi:hypothetical protein